MTRPQDTAAAPKGVASERGRSLRRRVPFYLLAVGLALLLLRYYQGQPSSVVVVYHIGSAGAGLERLHASYQRGGEEVQRATYRFAATGVSARPEHAVRLTDGDLELVVDLHYRGEVPPTIRKRSSPLGARTVRMRRLLPVRGDGKVTVFIGDDEG